MSPVANNKNFSLVLLSVFGFEHIFFLLKLCNIISVLRSCKHFLNATFCLLLFSVICVFFFEYLMSKQILIVKSLYLIDLFGFIAAILFYVLNIHNTVWVVFSISSPSLDLFLYAFIFLSSDWKMLRSSLLPRKKYAFNLTNDQGENIQIQKEIHNLITIGKYFGISV